MTTTRTGPLLARARSSDDDAEGLASWLAAIGANEIRDRAEFFRRPKCDVRLRESWRSGFDPVAGRVVSEASRNALEERLARLECALWKRQPVRGVSFA